MKARLHLCTAAHGRRVHTVPIVVHERSALSAQLQFDFLENDMELALDGVIAVSRVVDWLFVRLCLLVDLTYWVVLPHSRECVGGGYLSAHSRTVRCCPWYCRPASTI
jgi:hypothetical protein